MWGLAVACALSFEFEGTVSSRGLVRAEAAPEFAGLGPEMKTAVDRSATRVGLTRIDEDSWDAAAMVAIGQARASRSGAPPFEVFGCEGRTGTAPISGSSLLRVTITRCVEGGISELPRARDGLRRLRPHRGARE